MSPTYKANYVSDDYVFRKSDEWKQLRMEAIAASDGRCFYCQVKLHKPHVDHLLPRSRGGSDNLENLVVCCGSCNSKKGQSTPTEWYIRQIVFECAKAAVAAELGSELAQGLKVSISHEVCAAVANKVDVYNSATDEVAP